VPEVGTFARPADSSPGAPRQREVEQNERVCGTQAHVKYVVWAEIALRDPRSSLYELILCSRPRLGLHRFQAVAPEDVVQMDDREIGECAQLLSESRLTGGATTEDDYALHLTMVTRTWRASASVIAGSGPTR
jgi:hypothetical protein